MHPILSSLMLPILTTILLLTTPTHAVCCSNHNLLCILNSQTCDPNCADGISRCDLSSQTCKNDKVGGCIDNVVVTSTRTKFPPTATSTVFTGTTTVYDGTSTSTVLYVVTASEVSTAVRMMTVTNTHFTSGESESSASAAAASSSTTAAPARRYIPLLRRDSPSTVTTTITVTDEDHCRYTSEPACTTTVSAVSSVKAAGNANVTVTSNSTTTAASWIGTSTVVVDVTAVGKKADVTASTSTAGANGRRGEVKESGWGGVVFGVLLGVGIGL